MEKATEKVKDIERYIIQKGTGVSNKKLQLLLYFSQAWFTALNNEDSDKIEIVLFKDKIEAWRHGPSVPASYQRYKKFGTKYINNKKLKYKLNPSTIDFLDEILKVYNKYTEGELESISHKQSPWVDVFSEHANNIITPKSMFECFIKYAQTDQVEGEAFTDEDELDLKHNELKVDSRMGSSATTNLRTSSGKKNRYFEKISSFDKKRSVTLPSRATSKSAGYDFHVHTEEDVVEIKPGQVKIINTGVKASIPDDEFLSLHVRSSIGIKHGIILANATGIIDADYYNNPDNEGHIMIALRNMSDESVYFKHGDRVAQGVFMKYQVIVTEETLSKRAGGLGSTGGN